MQHARPGFGKASGVDRVNADSGMMDTVEASGEGWPGYATGKAVGLQESIRR